MVYCSLLPLTAAPVRHHLTSCDAREKLTMPCMRGKHRAREPRLGTLGCFCKLPECTARREINLLNLIFVDCAHALSKPRSLGASQGLGPARTMANKGDMTFKERINARFAVSVCMNMDLISG